MKTKIRRHYRSAVSVLLSVCMLVSCIAVGLIGTDAAKITDSESVGWNGDPTYVNLHLWKEVSGTTYTGDTVMTTKNQHYTVSFGNLPDRSSIKFGLNAKDGTTDQWLLPDTNVDNQSVGDEKKYIWMKTIGRNQVMSFDTGCDYEVWWDSTDNNGNGIQISFKKAPQNNPTKITAGSGCTATVSNGTTTITSTGSANSGNLTQNSTATVTIKPPTGKKVTTATLTGGTSQTLNLISNHDGTYSATYTVPSNTTETAITFSDPVDKSSYKVNVVSSDVSEGTVAATVGGSALDPNTSYPEDTEITLTATEGDGFSFVKWDYKTTTASSANPATYYVNGEDATGTTINITGEFGEHGYYIKIGTTGSYTAMTLLGNGKYISTAKVGSGNNDANKFMIKRSSDNNYANPGDNDYKFKADWISAPPVGWVDDEPNNKYFYQDNVSSGAALYVLYDPATDIISFSDDPQGHTPTTVLVKRGAVFSDGDGANIRSAGTSVKNGTNVVSATVAGANKTNGFSDQWQEKNSNPAVYYVRQVDFTAAEVGKGAKITVATTVKDNTLKVVGFVVNGESVLGSDITVSDDTLTYTMTYTIPEYPDTKIEITPVYAKKSGTIRFYVEGVDGEIRTKWGDTVYCYAYYGSAGTTATYGLGTWPGQPLLYDNGRYFIDLAEYDGNNKINGIALNNGTWDTVHAYRILGSQTDSVKNTNQCQSYDYNDFEKINNLENEQKLADPSYVKADIIFEMKSKGVVEPANSNFGTTFDRSGSSYPETIKVNDFTGWEYLTDYYGKRVDVFGNIIDPTDTHYNDEPYRLVSQGYDENSVGYFATAWVVYQKSGSTYNKLTSVGSNGYVGMDSESKFLDSGLENQEGWSALKGKPAMITYEYGVYQEKGNAGHSDDVGPKPATRYDGRWYVSKVLDVKAHVLIEYGRSEHSTFTRDYFQEGDIDYKSASGYDPSKVEGLVTKTKAHFSETPYSTESKKSTAKNADGSSVNKFNFVAEDDTEGKYTFIGWYKYNDKNEAERVSTKKNYSVDVKNSEELIARFIKTPAGSVIISHDLLTGSEGLGTTLNSVSIVESDKLTPVAAVDPNPITSSSTGAAKIDSKAITVDNAFDVNNSYADRGRWVKIELNTTPNSADFLHFYYDIDKSDTTTLLVNNVAPASSGFTVSVDETNKKATIYVPLSYFFKVESGDKVFDTDKDTLRFYSELEVTKRTVTIKKVLPDFVSDSSTGFSVHIKVSDTENGIYSDLTGTFTSSIPANSGSFTDGKVAIHNGETITFAVDKNKYFKVTEENIPSPYEFDALYFTNDTSNNLGNGYKCLADSDKSFEVRNKVFANYTINYTYPSRFNNLTGETLYGDQTYTVNGKIDSTDADFSTYIDYTNSKVKEALVIAKNPFESDFMYNFIWDFNKTVYNPDGAAYTANVTTTTPTTQNVHVTFEFPYDYTNATGTGWTGTSNIYSATSDNPAKTEYQSPAAISIGYQKVPYALEPYTYRDENNELKTGNRIHCTTAPEKCGGKDFLYWSIREKAIGSDEWVEVAKCYTNEYTYATFNDYHVRPIFEGDEEADTTTEENKSEATIKFLDTSRNQWNNNQKGTKSTSYAGQDMVYADFDVAYRYKGQDVDDSTDLKVGVLIENIGPIDQNYLLDHRNTTSTEGKTAYTNSLNHYKDTANYNAEAIKTYLRSVIKGGTAAATAQATYQSTLGKTYTLNLKQRQPDQTLTNMNRVEYYHGSTVRFIAGNATDKVNEWTVNDANTSGVFRAYSYIVDAEGNVTLSEPTYYTLYGTAILDHLKTE